MGAFLKGGREAVDSSSNYQQCRERIMRPFVSISIARFYKVTINNDNNSSSSCNIDSSNNNIRNNDDDTNNKTTNIISSSSKLLLSRDPHPTLSSYSHAYVLNKGAYY